MGFRTRLQTVRFSPNEWNQVEVYLQQNPVFESFSSLARVATLAFIGEANLFRLQPVTAKKPGPRPTFLWDYDLSETQVREMLRRPGLPPEKCWLIERILSQARFEEVFDYLDLAELKRALPQLRLSPKIRRRWEYAISRWTSPHER